MFFKNNKWITGGYKNIKASYSLCWKPFTNFGQWNTKFFISITMSSHRSYAILCELHMQLSDLFSILYVHSKAQAFLEGHKILTKSSSWFDFTNQIQMSNHPEDFIKFFLPSKKILTVLCITCTLAFSESLANPRSYNKIN